MLSHNLSDLSRDGLTVPTLTIIPEHQVTVQVATNLAVMGPMLTLRRYVLWAGLAGAVRGFSTGAPDYACTHTGLPHGDPVDGASELLVVASNVGTYYTPGVPQQVIVDLQVSFPLRGMCPR